MSEGVPIVYLVTGATGRTWQRAASCPVCGKPNPPRRLTCSDECKKAAKKVYDKARYPEVREETIARACAWQAENRDRKQAYDAEYRERTREERLAAKREWSRRRRESQDEEARQERCDTAARRRARKEQSGEFVILARDRRRALNRARGRCAECEARFTEDNPLEWDHNVPIVRGGAHGIGNLRPLCRRCNRGKARRFLVEWRAGKVVDGRKVWQQATQAA